MRHCIQVVAYTNAHHGGDNIFHRITLMEVTLYMGGSNRHILKLIYMLVFKKRGGGVCEAYIILILVIE